MLGIEYNDTFTLGRGVVITKQSIVVGSSTSNLGDADGVLGLGPVNLSLGTLPNEPTMTIPTVTQNLWRQDIISQEIVSISFEPISSAWIVYGELTFGGVDSSKYTGYMAFV